MKVLLKWVELSKQSKVVLLSNPCTIGFLTMIFHLEKNVKYFLQTVLEVFKKCFTREDTGI